MTGFMTPRRPLVQAAIDGDLARVRTLVSAGEGVNDVASNGRLPIHGAAANDRDRVVAYLISAGSDIDVRGADGWTPLHLACASGSHRAVRALVDGGADVDAVAKGGSTPLHLALVVVLGKEHRELRRQAVRCARRMLERLLAAGADPKVLDSRGRCPADIAREKGAQTLALLLEGRSPRTAKAGPERQRFRNSGCQSRPGMPAAS